MRKIAFVFIFAFMVVACSGQVDFSGMEFTMTCPLEDDGNGIKWGDAAKNEFGERKTVTYDEKTKTYKCLAGEKFYHFYVRGKVCENCVEVNGMLLMAMIIVDLLVTGGIIILIYNCAQRKSSSAPSPAPASGRPGRANAPSVPDRDYEPLNPATRDNATYAVAGVHKTG
ncbi:hypothetical protein GJAV_G00051980 [Gymnothorax javanicus]|nr:hypothetical protein GJAV_G00051980 [Gymnothorax javanicus]